MWRLAMAVVAGLISAGCGGGVGEGETPEGAFRKVRDAAAAKNWETLFTCIAPSERKTSEEAWEEQKRQLDSPDGDAISDKMGMDKERLGKMSFKEYFFAAMNKLAGVPGTRMAEVKTARIIGRQIEGNRCTLTFRTGDTEGSLDMVQEEGRWYLGGAGRTLAFADW